MLQKSSSFVLASLKASTYYRARAVRTARGWVKKYMLQPLRNSALTDSHPSADVKRFGHCRLTDSPACTNAVLFIHHTVRLIILRVAGLAGALLDELFHRPLDSYVVLSARGQNV
jgi:hypothetical protein